LIGCGYGKDDIKHDHWHAMVENGLEANNIDAKYKGHLEDEFDDGELVARKWVIDNPAHHDVNLKPVTSIDDGKTLTPDWLFENAVTEAQPPRPLTPSSVLNLTEISTDYEIGNYKAQTDNGSALQFGNAVHALLQILPEIDSLKFDATIDGYLDGFADGLSQAQKIRVKNNLTDLMALPKMRALLDEPSKAEVSINGKVLLGEKEHIVNGQIDRLIVRPNEVVLIDYKTKLNPPKSPSSLFRI